MSKALVILHTSPAAADNRAFTAVRLAGALVADNKNVTMFLVEDGARLADPALSADNPCRDLFYELMDIGMQVFICGSTCAIWGGMKATQYPVSPKAR